MQQIVNPNEKHCFCFYFSQLHLFCTPCTIILLINIFIYFCFSLLLLDELFCILVKRSKEVLIREDHDDSITKIMVNYVP